MKRLECLDGLRGGLAVYVMVSHMAPFAVIPSWLARLLSHGGAAVDVFFILSGLVIARSLERFGYRARPFLMARILRIYPAFLPIFAVAMAVQCLPSGFERMPWVAGDSPARAIWSDGWPDQWRAYVLTHLTMTHGLVPNGVMPDAWVGFLGAAWSLSTEWQFYLLALVVMPRRGGSPAPWLGLALLGWGWDAWTPAAWHFSRAFLPNKAAYFALGIASMGGCGRYCLTLLAVLGLCWGQGGTEKLAAPLVWTLCLAAQHRPNRPGLGWLAALLRAPAAQWLGGLSYGLYLINEPVQKGLGVLLAWWLPGDALLFTVFWIPAATVLPLGLALIVHILLERPAMRWSRAEGRSGIVVSRLCRGPPDRYRIG